MNFHPIIMTPENVVKNQKGIKTMTRRIIKSRHESGLLQVCRRKSDGQVTSINSLDYNERNCEKDIICPYGKIGDVLWVRETYYEHGRYYTSSFDESGEIETRWFKNDKVSYLTDVKPEKCRIKSPIFMPKSICRQFLKITDIKVERLQDITEGAVKREGAGEEVRQMWLYGLDKKGIDKIYRRSFQIHWEKINGVKSWEQNPFVWAISYKLIDRPENFLK